MEKYAVALVNEVEPGCGRVVAAGGIEIGLFWVKGQFRAYRNLCPHAGAPVCRGEVTRTGAAREIVRCPWHAWEFDLETGENLADPACRLESFPVEVVDGQVVVSI